MKLMGHVKKTLTALDVPANLEPEFDDLVKDLGYTHAVGRKGHTFGRLSLWPKATGFEQQFRCKECTTDSVKKSADLNAILVELSCRRGWTILY